MYAYTGPFYAFFMHLSGAEGFGTCALFCIFHIFYRYDSDMFYGIHRNIIFINKFMHKT